MISYFSSSRCWFNFNAKINKPTQTEHAQQYFSCFLSFFVQLFYSDSASRSSFDINGPIRRGVRDTFRWWKRFHTDAILGRIRIKISHSIDKWISRSIWFDFRELRRLIPSLRVPPRQSSANRNILSRNVLRTKSNERFGCRFIRRNEKTIEMAPLARKTWTRSSATVYCLRSTKEA